MKTFEEWFEALETWPNSEDEMAKMAWDACAREHQAELTDMSCTINRQDEAITDLQRKLRALENIVLKRNQEIRNLEDKIVDLESELPEVKEFPDSEGWWWYWNESWWQLIRVEESHHITEKGRWVKAQEPRI